MDERNSIFQSLFFTGGVLAGLFLCETYPQLQEPLCSSLLIGMPAYSLFLWKNGIKKEKLFLLCVFATGLLCASIRTGDEGLFTWDWELTRSVKSFIRSIPFHDPQCGELITALLTGDRSGLPFETRESFRKSGASHLLALSGMHIGIIYLIISRIAEFFGNSPRWKKTRGMAIVLFCGCYTCAVGAGPSIVRAFLFILLRETAVVLERKTNSRDILCKALILQLILMPNALQEVGFQLSYLAMVGITFLYPKLRDFPPMGRFIIGKKIWESCALSLSCQAFTGPLAFLKFGSFPLYFLLTNLISAPLTSLIMGSALLLLVCHALAWDIPLLLTLNEGLCQALFFSLKIISEL